MSAPTHQSYAEFKAQFAEPVFPVTAPAASTEQTSAKSSAVSAVDKRMVLPWAFCLFIGFLGSNIATITEIYCGGIQTADGTVRSCLTPIVEIPLAGQFAAYIFLTAATIFGATKLSQRDFGPKTGGFALVPVVTVWLAVGFLMRKTGFAARFFCFVGLLAGTVLTGLSVLYFVDAPLPLPEYSDDPIIKSLQLQAGLALIASSIVSLLSLDRRTTV